MHLHVGPPRTNCWKWVFQRKTSLPITTSPTFAKHYGDHKDDSQEACARLFFVFLGETTVAMIQNSGYLSSVLRRSAPVLQSLYGIDTPVNIPGTGTLRVLVVYDMWLPFHDIRLMLVCVVCTWKKNQSLTKVIDQ